jgi:hypothetical protein
MFQESKFIKKKSRTIDKARVCNFFYSESDYFRLDKKYAKILYQIVFVGIRSNVVQNEVNVGGNSSEDGRLFGTRFAPV